MAEANKDEVDKCKQIARSALAAGDSDKAARFLQKAKRMNPGDESIDRLLQEAMNGGGGEPKSPSANDRPQQGPRPTAAGRATAGSAPAGGGGASRADKAGNKYTSEQMQEVQKILRTKDYYEIMNVSRDASEDQIKKQYKKMALRLHPDKNHAPGAEEAFKKVSKALQCLTDPEKKQVYDQYGDEDQIPQSRRQAYHHQGFQTPEDLFAAFFGHSFHNVHVHHHGHGNRAHHGDDDGPGAQRAHFFQMLPVLLLVVLTLASNFASRDTGSRFQFAQGGQYRNERTTTTLDVTYYVTDGFEEHYSEGTRALADFEKQVEIYYVRSLLNECDYQEKVMYKKVVMAKRRNIEAEVQKARQHPRPACKEIEKIKTSYSQIYRSAMYMGAY